jgi:4-hydroxyphenylpyruvate dioxygenase-like putative hemolysin
VLRNNEGVLFAFSSPYTKDKEDMHRHHGTHGDGVKDVAFRVEDARAIYEVQVLNILPRKLFRKELHQCLSPMS